MSRDILVGVVLFAVMELVVYARYMFMIKKSRNERGKESGLENEERSKKIEIIVRVIHEEEREGAAAVNDSRKCMPETKEDASISNTQTGTWSNPDKDNAIIEKKESIRAENKKESDAPAVMAKGTSYTFLAEANQKISKEGYNAWVQESWRRIGTGGESLKIGEPVTLKYGEGDIRVISRINEERYLGVPVKGRWKGCDFKRGAYGECYEVPPGIDENSNYEIVMIKRPAILYREDEYFHVQVKGIIQVQKI